MVYGMALCDLPVRCPFCKEYIDVSTDDVEEIGFDDDTSICTVNFTPTCGSCHKTFRYRLDCYPTAQRADPLDVEDGEAAEGEWEFFEQMED